MGLYSDINEKTAAYKERARKILEKRNNVRKVTVGKKSLVDIIKKGLEDSADLLSGQMLIPEKECYHNMIVIMSNVCRIDLEFAYRITNDMGYILTLIFPQHMHELPKITPVQYEAAILVAADESGELVKKYWQNPAYDPPDEYWLPRQKKQVEKSKGLLERFKEALFGDSDKEE